NGKAAGPDAVEPCALDQTRAQGIMGTDNFYRPRLLQGGSELRGIRHRGPIMRKRRALVNGKIAVEGQLEYRGGNVFAPALAQECAFNEDNATVQTRFEAQGHLRLEPVPGVDLDRADGDLSRGSVERAILRL